MEVCTMFYICRYCIFAEQKCTNVFIKKQNKKTTVRNQSWYSEHIFAKDILFKSCQLQYIRANICRRFTITHSRFLQRFQTAFQFSFLVILGSQTNIKTSYRQIHTSYTLAAFVLYIFGEKD